MNILAQEINDFIKEMNSKEVLSIKKKEDYYFGMEKAFDDAFNQYARREKKKYADEKKELMEKVVERMYSYFTNDTDDFDNCYNECIKISKQILDNGRYGIAQKFVNMSFKYLYCYNGALEKEQKFEKCHMPLDKYTINWVKSLKSKQINKQLSAINNAWANLDEELYREIQDFIAEKLASNFEYRISFNPHAPNGGKCVLPNNRLLADFIIWHQERINEVHKIIENNKNDFDRLGIEAV